MPAVVRLSVQEVDKMIADIEASGGDAEELKKYRAGVADSKWLEKHAKPLGEEEHIADLRSKSHIEHGKNLECVVCHNKVDTLVSGKWKKDEGFDIEKNVQLDIQFRDAADECVGKRVIELLKAYNTKA
ncbi:unnamed protein product, partial [marine sediment metagenome]